MPTVMERVILLLVICIPGVHAADQTCPWLNAATAGGVLEGPVHDTVIKDGENATCEFARQNSADKLRIEVVTISASRGELAAYKAQCVTPLTPLKAIGNEAVVCDIGTKSGGVAEQVAGRVRKRAFLVSVTSATFSRESLREKATKVAEQIAGNLF